MILPKRFAFIWCMFLLWAATFVGTLPAAHALGPYNPAKTIAHDFEYGATTDPNFYLVGLNGGAAQELHVFTQFTVPSDFPSSGNVAKIKMTVIRTEANGPFTNKVKLWGYSSTEPVPTDQEYQNTNWPHNSAFSNEDAFTDLGTYTSVVMGQSLSFDVTGFIDGKAGQLVSFFITGYDDTFTEPNQGVLVQISTPSLIEEARPNTAPVITSNGGGSTATVSADEGTTAVTTVTATDAESNPLTYSISGGADASAFKINSASGLLTFDPDAPPPDRETKSVYIVVVKVEDSDGLSDTQTITVNISDVNDTSPVITSNGGGTTATITVPENTTAVTTVTAADADTTGTLSFSISGGADAASFAINTGSGELTFVTPPDRETKAAYAVTVQVSDGVHTVSQAITVNISDVNEFPPVITSNGGLATATIDVAENTSAVTTVTAADVDADAVLAYSISGGADASSFNIDSATGELAFKTAPDRETKAVYAVTVQVTDGDNTATQAITVNVTDVNDISPEITSNGGGAAAELTVPENTTAVTTVTATDADTVGSLEYSINEVADWSAFVIDENTGVLTFKTAPDHETKASYSVTVQVSDGIHNDTQAITVNISDVNEFPPVITSNGGLATATIDVAENTTAVTTVTTTDEDATSVLTYSISVGADASAFDIDPATGALIFKTAPDYETKATYTVTIQVTDGDNTATQAITVNVTDANDTSPVITSNGGGATATITVPENTIAVTTVTATDADTVGHLEYSISELADWAAFSINSTTGKLTFKSAPDRETKALYSVTVQVSDGANTVTQTITVNVTDVNDSSPVITSNGGGAAATISVAENTVAVTTVTATDADSSGTLMYSIIGGAEASAFAIDAASGQLSFISAPDYETKLTFVVVVQATDGTTSPDTQEITVNITDVNEYTPIITSNGGGDSADIAVNDGAIDITTVTATDGDGSAELHYEISGGTDAGKFSIGSETGKLVFTTSPDFGNPADANLDNVYEVNVRVTDSLYTDSQTIRVSILDTSAPDKPVLTLSHTGWTNSNVTATVSGEPGSKIEYRLSDSPTWSIYSAPVVYTAEGEYRVQAKQTDAYGNVSEAVYADVHIDKTKPVIRLTGDPEVNVYINGTFTDPGATVTDNLTLNLQATVTGSVNTGVIGTYTLHYNAVDNAGNAAVEQIRTVHVLPTPTGLFFDSPSYTFADNETAPFTVRMKYSDGSEAVLTDQSTYSFVPTGIAQVTTKGILEGVHAGSTVIKAVYGSQQATADVTVKPVLKKLQFNNPAISIKVGKSADVAVQAIYSDGSERNVTSEASYQFTAAGIVEWLRSGVLSGRSEGTTVVGATYGAKTAELQVTVYKEPASVEIGEALDNIVIGYAAGDSWESVTKNISLPYAGLHDTVISWSSSNPQVLSASGVVSRRTDQSVTIDLVASIEKDGVTMKRTFLIIVKKIGQEVTNEDSSRTVPVRVGQEQEDVEQTTITRKTTVDGTKIDKVDLDPVKAQTALEKALKQNNPVVRIVITDIPSDRADEVAVQVSAEAFNGLASKADLALETEEASVVLSDATLEGLKNEGIDLFFRFVPIRKEQEQEQIKQQALSDQHVKQEAGNRTVSQVGTPMTIETNYSSYSTKLIFPLSKLNAPADSSALTAYLSSLYVYIEHRDGEIEVKQGSIERDASGKIVGLSIVIDKFSTFTILKMDAAPEQPQDSDPSSGGGVSVETEPAPAESTQPSTEAPSAASPPVHTAYINGYADGMFRPEQTTTRAELAAMLWRIIQHDEAKTDHAVAAGYADVPQSHWAYEAIAGMKERGIMLGVGEGLFEPDRPITRAEFAALAARWKQLPLNSQAQFPDVSGHWASKEIGALVQAGVAAGYADGTFSPDKGVTRAEMVKMLNRLLKRGPLSGVTKQIWKDVEPSHWAFQDIAEASLSHTFETLQGTETFIAEQK